MNNKLIYTTFKGIGLAALLVCAAGNSRAQTYTAIDLGAVLPSGINNGLQVTGNNFNTLDGFLYSNGSLIDIGALGSEGSQAFAINGSGQITGTSSTATQSQIGLPHAFLYSGGTLKDLGTLPGGGESQGNGINSSGQVVGWSQTSVVGDVHAFLYSGGTLTDLGPVPGESSSQATGINDKGQVIGRAYAAGGGAFLYSSGSWMSLGILPGFATSAPTGINNNGQVVGYSQNTTGGTHAFLYSGTTLTDLGTLPGGSMSAATGININGEVVGYSLTGGSVYHAFLYNKGSMVDLNSLVTLPTGVYLNYANGINDFGQIVAAGNNGHGYLLITNSPTFGSLDTPTPGSPVQAGAIPVTGWALSGAGIQTVAIWRKPVAGEGAGSNGLVFIQNTDIVVGTRPDVALAHPGYPCNNCGWGTELLTNELPNSSGTGPIGNGTYELHALATNNAGQVTDIGSVTITVDNKDSVVPFGTIDTPTEGGTASGTAFVNFGWALTPQPNLIPFDGSTITVYIDNAAVGHPVYNIFRADIAQLFPGYQNSMGAIGYFYIDTTKLTNGLHTIAWVATDSAGHSSGLGSRYFTVQN